MPLDVVRKPAKIVTFDIETTNLKASFGEVLMFGYMEEGWKQPEVVRLDAFKGWGGLSAELKDKYLLEWVWEYLSDADMLIGQYSTRFDMPFLQSRLLRHKMPVLPPIPQLDTWWIMRKKLALGRNSLDAAAKFFGLPYKKDVPTHIWRRANCFEREALDLVEDRCRKDVLITHKLAKRIMALAPNSLPNRQLLEGGTKPACPQCGSTRLQRRGFCTTRARQYVRYWCKACGRWPREAVTTTRGVKSLR